jgi:hypothetical protein
MQAFHDPMSFIKRKRSGGEAELTGIEPRRGSGYDCDLGDRDRRERRSGGKRAKVKAELEMQRAALDRESRLGLAHESLLGQRRRDRRGAGSTSASAVSETAQAGGQDAPWPQQFSVR